MIIILSIIALIIAIIVLTIRYIRINAKTLSRKTFEEEARKQAAKLKATSPVITCDYCGSSIDTGKFKTCPSCGGSYSDDKEWQRRHATNFDWADLNAEKLAEKKLAEAKKKSAKTAAKLKKAIISLCIITGVIVVLAGISGALSGGHYYAENEELNAYSFEKYAKASYDIDGDSVILDQDGIKAEITGIYKNYDEFDHGFKIGYKISNATKDPVCVRFARCGVNGLSGESSYSFYRWIKAKDAVTIYDKIYDIEDDGISSLVYHDIGYTDEDYNTYNKDGYLSFKTTNKKEYIHKLPEGNIIFDKNGVKIVCKADAERGYLLWIENSSDCYYEIKTSDMKVDGTAISSYGIYSSLIPPGHLFCSDYVYTFDMEMTDLMKSDNVSLSIEFKCKEDPARDFSTGYIKINE